MKKLYPVIHVRSLEQALQNAKIAFDANCDGIFLINHENKDGIREILYPELLTIHAAVHRRFPDWWIGLNCLDLPTADVFQHLNPAVSGVWADNGEIDESEPTQPKAQQILNAKRASGWQGAYFGGVAFKYQRPVSNSAEAARIGKEYIDIVTTSGRATGETPSIEKIRRMKQAIDPRPLAIASGITPKNVDQYLTWADIFLVATGISSSFYELDIEKVRQLSDIVHNWVST
ncbi:MAG: BtpA/SgcQ family protein [Anaerolineae bacterium]